MATELPDHGYRRRYLDYATLTAQLEAWVEAQPELARLESLATTPEGREVWLLTVGPEPERRRPAVWVDGNLHAGELATSSAALAIAEATLRVHLEGASGADVPEPVAAVLREALVYVCPRISPDGAEAVLTRGGFVRSVPRATGERDELPHWRLEDLDGDGVCRHMRRPDPGGEFVAADGHEGLMLPRRPEDPPPYYKVYPEGRIVHWDGHTVPEPDLLAGTTDLNRNFPWDWRPEPQQRGAGPYPGAEPESRAVVAWAARHPEVYAWLNLHTFGGVFIRPLGDAPDSRMRQRDLAVYRQLAAWGEEHVGYPTVSGYEEFTYEPEKPLHGDLSDFAYHQRGCLAEVCELWDLFARLGLPRQKPFVRHYTALSRTDLRRLARWDAEENQGRIFGPWRRHRHPQLGEVELGGPDPRVGIWNPPYEALAGLCERLSAYWLRVAALVPRLVIEAAALHELGNGTRRLTLTVANHGYLPTWGVEAARELPWNTPLHAELRATGGCRLVDGEPARRELGHLEGWGRGLGHMSDGPWLPGSRGGAHRRVVAYLLEGEGEVAVRVGAPRTGWVEERLTVGG